LKRGRTAARRTFSSIGVATDDGEELFQVAVETLGDDPPEIVGVEDFRGCLALRMPLLAVCAKTEDGQRLP